MSVEDEKTHKCYKCGQRFKNGQSKYHDFYCQKYSYEEFLKLMNEYPATEYTEEEKIKLGLLPENASWWKSNSPEFMQEYSCFPSDEKVVNHPVFGNATYIPTQITFDEAVIEKAVDALESGLEYAQEILVRHDYELGRTTRRNQKAAELIEEDIEKIKASIKELKR